MSHRPYSSRVHGQRPFIANGRTGVLADNIQKDCVVSRVTDELSQRQSFSDFWEEYQQLGDLRKRSM
jgi:hypothetical protein